MNKKWLARLTLIATVALLQLTALAAAPARPINERPTMSDADNQQSEAPKAVPAEANPADVKSMDAIVAALYDVISGPAGKKRDWDRFRSLFVPGARLIPAAQRPGGPVEARVLDPEGYVTRSAPFLEKQGFYEREISRKVESFGHIAH